MSKVLVGDAATIFRLLNGICCVFKPAGETVGRVRRSLLHKLSNELCQLEHKEPTPYVNIEGDTTKPMKIDVFDSFVDNPLVMGPKYEPSDFKCLHVNLVGKDTSGVLLFGLNKGIRDALQLRHANPLRVYQVKGCLGEAKNNLFASGKTVGTSKFQHVTLGSLQQTVASIQASHQRIMFDMSGVDMESEAAYQLAVSGLIRPESRKLPIIYGIKCIDFDPPNFTIEVSCINEYEAYLKALVHDIGVKVRSVAHTTAIQCVRHSVFFLQHSLLKKHWTLQFVLDNLSASREMLRHQGQLSHTLDHQVSSQTS